MGDPILEPGSGSTESGVGLDPVERRRAGFWLGMKLHLLIAAPVFLILVLLHRYVAVAIATFCLWQWLYLGPALFIADRRCRAGILTAGLATMAMGTLTFVIGVTMLCRNFR